MDINKIKIIKNPIVNTDIQKLFEKLEIKSTTHSANSGLIESP